MVVCTQINCSCLCSHAERMRHTHYDDLTIGEFDDYSPSHSTRSSPVPAIRGYKYPRSVRLWGLNSSKRDTYGSVRQAFVQWDSQQHLGCLVWHSTAYNSWNSSNIMGLEQLRLPLSPTHLAMLATCMFYKWVKGSRLLILVCTCTSLKLF